MLIYPQPSSRALVQYPSRKRVRPGSSSIATPGGARHTMYDPAARVTEWELHYAGLTEAEAQALWAFFEQTEGRYRSFAFVDPMTNLLGWSEWLDHPAWQRGALVNVTMGQQGPSSGSAAATIVNGAQVPSGVGQTVSAPAEYNYCLSVWLKSGTETACDLVIGGTRKQMVARSQWTRVEATGYAGVTPLRFAVETEPGGVVSICGMQAEAQLSASEYMPTTGSGGLHPSARFDQDALALEAHGPDDYRTNIRIVSNRQE